MKNINKILLSTMMVLIIFALMPSALGANTFKLVPQHSSNASGDPTYVDLVMDAQSTNFDNYQIRIYFNHSVVNITHAQHVWGDIGGYNVIQESGDLWYLLIGRMIMPPGFSSGNVTLANLTLECQGLGVSDLNFSQNMLWLGGPPVTNTTENGTHTCQGTPPPPQPDLVVPYIDPRTDVFRDATNVFTFYIENQGTNPIPNGYDVYYQFENESQIVHNGTYAVTDLSDTTNFEVLYKPLDYENLTVSAWADCNNNVAELDDTNNNQSTTYVKRPTTSGTGLHNLSFWEQGGDNPLVNYKNITVTGDQLFTFGDSVYLSGYNNQWPTYTTNFSLGSEFCEYEKDGAVDIPAGSVKEARLYMYYNWYRYPNGNRTLDPENIMTMTLNGNPITTEVQYEDCKGFGGSYALFKFGTFAYNVTDIVNSTGNGAYQAVLTNAGEGDTHHTSIYGIALFVIVEDPSGCPKEYIISEGHELLKQNYYYGSSSSHYGRYGYYVTPEDVTSTTNMPEVTLTGATSDLFTVAQAAASSPNKSALYFNGDEWTDAWLPLLYGNTGTDTIEGVTTANPNVLTFQDRSDGYSATNGIIISKLGYRIDLGLDQVTDCDNGICGPHVWIPITLNDFDCKYGAVEMNLSYDPTKFELVTVHSAPHSNIYAYNDYDTLGIVDISAMYPTGYEGDILLATAEFEVIGGCGTCSEFNLTVDNLQDIYYNDLDTYTVPVEICIVDAGSLIVNQSLAIPNGSISDGILHWNFRCRHLGDDELIIQAQVFDSGAGIDKVEVDLSSIGGGIVQMSPIGGGWYEYTAKATDGINELHTFTITAWDNTNNKATGTTDPIFVYRRGDVHQNNAVNIIDAYRIAQFTVGLYTPPDPVLFDFLGDVQPACDGAGNYLTNMCDALYIARYTVGLEASAP